jgi:hypothetical protein
MAMATFHKVAMAVLHMLAIRAEAPQLACRGTSRSFAQRPGTNRQRRFVHGWLAVCDWAAGAAKKSLNFKSFSAFSKARQGPGLFLGPTVTGW